MIAFAELIQTISARKEAIPLDGRTIDPEFRLIPYYPDYTTTLPWYQDLSLCKQVDNRDAPYDLELLQRMYDYLNTHGDLFYIQYQATLCGDVCLQPSGEINIVIAKPFQNKHIGEQLVSDSLVQGKAAGFQLLQFNAVVENNIHARHLYERLGFVHLGTIPKGFQMKDGSYQNICIYYHQL